MTRSERNIEREIDVARADLEDNLSELKATVRDKLDVRKRVREAYDRRMLDARIVVRRLIRRARERPLVTIGALAGALGVTTLALVAYNRRA